jgi:LacI family transcriptional regulator
MRDVAARVGVTAFTVSLCLRGNPSITPATRARVLVAVQELGYRPNPMVRALMRSRRHRGAAPGGPALAFVTGFPTRDGWRRLGTCVFAQMFDGALARAEQCGYQLQEFWLHEQGMTARRFADVLLARGIRGLLVAPMPEPNASLQLPWENFTAVALGTTLVQPALHRVASDLYSSMLTAMEECHRLGYRRIGLALRISVNQKVQRRWLAAYLLAQAELPGLVPLAPLLAEPVGEQDFLAWFDRERPEVVIETAPHRARQWLEARGLRVPGDVGIVSLSAPAPGDPETGIYQNAGQIGLRAVDLLVSLLERNESGVPALPDTLLVNGTWNPGHTVSARCQDAVALR